MSARRAATLLVLGVMATTPARADLTPVSSSFGLTAYAFTRYGIPKTSTDSQSQGATTNPLGASVEANSGAYNPSWLTVTASGSATWTTPSQGEVKFTNVGWSAYQGNGNAFLDGSTGWTYTFVANAAGPFTIDYSVTAYGSTIVGPPLFTGLNDFYVYWGKGTTPPDNAIAEVGINSSGTLDLPITAPGTYTIEIQPGSWVSGGIGTTDIHMDGTFDFSAGPGTPIAVPEMSSMTMAIAITALAAGATRLIRAWT